MNNPSYREITLSKTPSTFYDSDECCPKEDAQDQLKWRASPEESFSDWTIEIVSWPDDSTNGADGSSDGNCNESEKIVDVYHVHKMFLAFGTRKSRYFDNLFRNADHFNESEVNTSRIELHPIAAKAFPHLLDFLYFPELPLNIDTENATALCFLGEYFQMSHLTWQAKEFCKKDLSMENIGTYYLHSQVFHNEKVLNYAAQFLFQNIMEITPSSTVIKITDPQLWINVLRKGTGDANIEFSLHMSDLIAEYGMEHVQELDASTFKQLTQREKMPSISHKSALKLMEVSDNLRDDDEEVQDVGLLEERCISAMSSHWKNLHLKDTENCNLLCQREPSFLASLLTKIVDCASEELRISQEELKVCQRDLKAKHEELKLCQKNLQGLLKVLRGFRPLPSHESCEYHSAHMPASLAHLDIPPSPVSFIDWKAGIPKFPVYFYSGQQ